MKRRRLLTALGIAATAPLSGCSGDRRESVPSDGDPGTPPAAELSMTAVGDAEIAKRVTYDLDPPHRESERRFAASVVEDGSTTATAVSRPFPEERPFVYDGSVYELAYEVVSSEPATEFRLALTEIDGGDSGGETVAYDDLPEVDKAALERYGWDDGGPFETGAAPVLYRNDEASDSVLVPEPEYPVIAWESGERARVAVDDATDTEVKTFEYAARRIHESTERFGREVREEHEFALADLPEEQRAIVEEAVASERGYVAVEEEPPAAFYDLAERFSEREKIGKVYRDREDESASGRYVVRFGGDVYWTSLFVRDDGD